MSAEPEAMVDAGPRPVAAAAYVWMIVLASLCFPVPTAAIIAWLLSLVDTPVERVGGALAVGGQPALAVGWLWTGLPALVVGGAVMLATKAPLAKRVKGFTFLAVNAWLVALLILGFRFQYPADADSSFVKALTIAHPILMVLVVGVSLLYFRARILPEETGHNIGRAKERMDALETGGADG